MARLGGAWRGREGMKMKRRNQGARMRIGRDEERSENEKERGVSKKMWKLPTTKGMTW